MQITVGPLDLHKCSSRADRATLAGVPPCAGECRFVCGKPVGKRRRGPDLWDFCGRVDALLSVLTMVRNRAVASAILGALGEIASDFDSPQPLHGFWAGLAYAFLEKTASSSDRGGTVSSARGNPVLNDRV